MYFIIAVGLDEHTWTDTGHFIFLTLDADATASYVRYAQQSNPNSLLVETIETVAINYSASPGKQNSDHSAPPGFDCALFCFPREAE